MPIELQEREGNKTSARAEKEDERKEERDKYERERNKRIKMSGVVAYSG